MKCRNIGEGSEDQAVQECLACREVTRVEDATRVRGGRRDEAAQSLQRRLWGSYSYVDDASNDEYGRSDTWDDYDDEGWNYSD